MIRCKALLFDLDGTLIDSLAAVDRAWTRWAVLRERNPEDVLSQIHGRRSVDSLRALAPELDAVQEDKLLRSFECEDTDGVALLPGSLEVLTALPAGTWTIVTSGTSDVAHARLRAAGLPIPSNGVYGEDVSNGKPFPDPFLLAAKKLNVDIAKCAAFEDSPSGIRSVLASGALLVQIGAEAHPKAQICVPNLAALVFTFVSGEIQVGLA